MINNFFIGVVVLIIFLFGNCSSQADTNMNNEELQEVSQLFIKAICTKDTTAFYKQVDKEVLMASMNEWMQGGKQVTNDDLFFPFFFVYSPLKIRSEDLINMRNKDVFFRSFKIVDNEIIDRANVKLSIEWVQNLPEAEPQRIKLYLRNTDQWKIVNARWDTL